MDLEKSSHSVFKIRYHFVTAVKYRKALLERDVEQCIRQTLKGINERYNIVIDEVGFDQDHIHIFCGASPRHSPSQILDVIKSITAKQVFASFPKLKKQELWGGEFWSDGKYIATIGEETNEKIIKKYIQNQSVDKSEIDRRTGQLKLFKIVERG